MITDVHVHVFPDQLAAKAVPFMAAEAGIEAALSGTVADLLQSMDKAGIQISWLQPVATKPNQIESINRWHEELCSDRIVSFGAVHPDFEDLPGLIRDLSARNFPGIKFHPEYHHIEPDDERLFPMYEALIEEGMIVLFHAGYDIGIPELHSTPRHFASLNDRFPELITILAHMGGYQQWPEVEAELMGRNVYLDTSYVFREIQDEEFLRLVEKHGQDKILYGSDSPWAGQQEDLEHLKSILPSEECIDLIFGLNAKNLLERVTK